MTERRTDREVMELMMGNSPFNEARQQFSFACAAMEQAESQKKPPTVLERRRMEFEAVERIVAALGIKLEKKHGVQVDEG